MIVTMITGIQGYNLTSAEIQTVIDVVQEKFAPEINYIDVRNMNMDCGVDNDLGHAQRAGSYDNDI